MSSAERVYHLNRSLPRLEPILHPWMVKLLEGKPLPSSSSPFQLWNPAVMAENLDLLREPLRLHQISYKILYSRKANHDECFVKQARNLGLAVENASLGELRSSAALGVQELVLSTSGKSRELIEVAGALRATVVIDNLDELQLITSLSHSSPLWLRVGGVRQENGETHQTRFGLHREEIRAVLRSAETPPISGLHVHIADYAVSSRVSALRMLFELADEGRSLGHPITHLDLGGGIPICYLKDREEYQLFEGELRRALLGLRDEITFQNHGLGLIAVNGEIHGSPGWYPFYREQVKGDFIGEILNSPLGSGTVSETLRRSPYTVVFEPGRALLDQCGATFARVSFRKQDTAGRRIVGLEMNGTQLRASSAEFLLDPIPLFQGSDPVEVYLVGNYCLEQDLILKRRILLPRLPECGEWVMFPNTAGYVSHLFSTTGHLFPKPETGIYPIKE